MTNATDFFRGSDRWNVAQNPSKAPTAGATTNTSLLPTGQAVQLGEARFDPYYLLMTLPGETKPQYVMFEPFVPYSSDDGRKELSAFMTVSSDPENYGKINAYVMPRDQQVDGPALVDARIQQTPAISRDHFAKSTELVSPVRRHVDHSDQKQPVVCASALRHRSPNAGAGIQASHRRARKQDFNGANPPGRFS